MHKREVLNSNSANRLSIPRWMALALTPVVWFVAIPFGHGVVPWALSLFTPRFGWIGNRPGLLNLIGLLPVAIGSACLVWVMIHGLSHAADLPKRIDLDWKPKLLLRQGPYRFTRNPMYAAELMLWFGWSIFYGSIVVLIGFVTLCALVSFLVRREERDLARQFGDAYRQYAASVPRWV